MMLEPSAAASGGGALLHVLAVDDSFVDRKVIEMILRSSSYRVTVVDSGESALEILGIGSNAKASSPEEAEINMIITDYSMPEMNGYDLLKRLKGSSTSIREIPVVVVSSENIPNRIRRCLDEGAEDFLLKPLKKTDISRLCSRILQHTKNRSAAISLFSSSAIS